MAVVLMNSASELAWQPPLVCKPLAAKPLHKKQQGPRFLPVKPSPVRELLYHARDPSPTFAMHALSAVLLHLHLHRPKGAWGALKRQRATGHGCVMGVVIMFAAATERAATTRVTGDVIDRWT